MPFVDEVEITCISGRGGDGGHSFRREAKVPLGGPDGGDGGRGGHVVLRASANCNTLEHIRGQRVYRAEPGHRGGSGNKNGPAGSDLVLEVPVGTVLVDLETDDQVADLAEDGREVVVARGGSGGRGNVRFKTSTNRAPREYERGGDPVQRELRLELKLLADVGLLGFPNAGKSTLISRISAARPRIADYPFTTLVPNLGVVSQGYDRGFVVADIPGLVPGASEGVGLGVRFLKHVERCRFLLHLVSLDEEGEPIRDPLERHAILNAELGAFSADLALRPQVTVLTKVDAVPPEQARATWQRFKEAHGEAPVVISAVTGEGLDRLVRLCARRLSTL